jgi:hypothetical protein
MITAKGKKGGNWLIMPFLGGVVSSPSLGEECISNCALLYGVFYERE